MTADGIILAAGLSSRMGDFKPAMMLGKKTVIERAIDSMAICERIIVVGGHRIDRLREIIRETPRIEIVFNRRFEEGMFTSVKAGIERSSAERIFILPGDIPLVESETLRAMMGIDAEILIPKYRGRKGHPLMLKGGIAKKLLAEPDDSNLRDFTRKIGFTTIDVDDEGILLDMDSPKDYEKLKGKI